MQPSHLHPAEESLEQQVAGEAGKGKGCPGGAHQVAKRPTFHIQALASDSEGNGESLRGFKQENAHVNNLVRRVLPSNSQQGSQDRVKGAVLRVLWVTYNWSL